ncbi:WecB/TagA/CpsF family glycosyltransferase [Ramlibacter rhizophilus]
MAITREKGYVCFANVHSVVTARSNDEFLRSLCLARFVVPDGAPVAWAVSRFGETAQSRVPGPDLMLRQCELAEAEGLGIFLYGATSRTLNLLARNLGHRFPRIKIVGMYAPPFRTTTREEDAAITAAINASTASIVFVGLGCPKQELWMARNSASVNAVMLGVGAAFDFHAGVIRRAPLWMRGVGLEWLHRFCCEPRRLWARYLGTGLRFAWAVGAHLTKRS